MNANNEENEIYNDYEDENFDLMYTDNILLIPDKLLIFKNTPKSKIIDFQQYLFFKYKYHQKVILIILLVYMIQTLLYIGLNSGINNFSITFCYRAFYLIMILSSIYFLINFNHRKNFVFEFKILMRILLSIGVSSNIVILFNFKNSKNFNPIGFSTIQLIEMTVIYFIHTNLR